MDYLPLCGNEPHFAYMMVLSLGEGGSANLSNTKYIIAITKILAVLTLYRCCRSRSAGETLISRTNRPFLVAPF